MKGIALVLIAGYVSSLHVPSRRPWEKPGTCPVSDIIPTCDCRPEYIECNGDHECPGAEKCCSYGCGCRTKCVNPFQQKPKGCTYNGVRYRVGQRFPSSDGCNTCVCGENGLVSCTEKACIDPTRNICTQPQISGPCEAYIPRYWYNVTTNQCEQFVYGGCQGNDNNFGRIEDCQNQCQRRTCTIFFFQCWGEGCWQNQCQIHRKKC